jgi:hypothetical protein
MTKKEYIGAYLDGYFSDKKLDFGINYYSILNDAIDTAEKKWKKYQKLEFPKQNIIDEWLDKNGCSEIEKQVEDEAKELHDLETIKHIAEYYWLKDNEKSEKDRIAYVDGFIRCYKWHEKVKQ